MKVIQIHHRSDHHAKNSGYGRLGDFMEAKSVAGTTRFPYRLAKLIGGFHSQSAGSYDTKSVLKEWELYNALRKKEEGIDLVHYLNAERDVRHMVRHKNSLSQAKFCGTFHKPPSILEKTIKDTTYLRHLDGVIAVGINQVDFLKEWLKIDQVQFIPHGVDTAFFTPADAMPDEKRILFVGQHLRDFETFNKSIEVISKKHPEIAIDVVIHKAYARFISPHASIHLHMGLDDLALRSIYQKASLLFLPLHEVTACNSLLEGMSCGLPIITSAVGGNASYLEGTANILVPKQDAAACISALTALLADEDESVRIGKSSRLKAQEYDWAKISQQTFEFYMNVSKIS